MEKPTFYITTTLPYVNDAPHIGFALEIIQADALARIKRMMGYDVIFNTGTDEHGAKIYEKAVKEGKNPQEYCDEYAAKFSRLREALNLTYTNFIRTTDPDHIRAAQYFWTLCKNNGDIYKKNYRLKYCKGCELEKTDSELVDGRCPLHPKTEIEIIEEENYFFSLSKYSQKLLDFYKQRKDFVIPVSKYGEIKSFVKSGLNDFSISRLKNKMPWGIPVPDDNKHVMYVWFDALINYISTIGWPRDMEKFNRYWPVVQVAGKDNLRQQSAMWQGMLMSAGVECSRQIFIHGFITADGQKMSKSLGNVVDPFKVLSEYGTDALRFYLLREISTNKDGDYSDSRMRNIYETELANELGNLVSRLTNLGEKDGIVVDNPPLPENEIFPKKVIKYFDGFNFSLAVQLIWEDVKKLNKKINDFEPWRKKPGQRKIFLTNSLRKLNLIARRLAPIIPVAAETIIAHTRGKIAKCPPLFPKNNNRPV